MMVPAAYSVICKRKDSKMKFTVNRKAFMKVISPALAVAGRKSEKYKVEKVAKIPSHTLDTCVRDVHEKIMSETSRQYPGKEYGSLTWKQKHSINQQVYMTAEVDFERLRRVTIIVCKEKLTISASNGSIVLKTEIAGDDLDDLAYRCDEEGILTVESSCLKLFLETLEKYDKLVFSSDCSSIVTIQSEQNKGGIRTVEQCPNRTNDERNSGVVE